MYPNETHIAPRIFVLSQILFKIQAFKFSKLEVGHPVELELADKLEDTGTTISLKLFQLVFLSNLTKK